MRRGYRVRAIGSVTMLVVAGCIGVGCNNDSPTPPDSSAGAGQGGQSEPASAGAGGTAGARAAGSGPGGAATAGAGATNVGGEPETAGVGAGGASGASSCGEHGGGGGDGGDRGDRSGGDGGQAGASGGDSGGQCVRAGLLGTYDLQVHNEVAFCPNATGCPLSPDTVQESSGTFSLYQVRENGVIQGELHVPGVTLQEELTGAELWDSVLDVYYLEPGNSLDIWSEGLPAGTPGWDPTRTSGVMRVMATTCYTDLDVGFVHIDIDVATGHVIGFARKCHDLYDSGTSEYRLSGSGQLQCDPYACNDLQNTATAATAVDVAQAEAMTRGEIHSGTYHLTTINYFNRELCGVSLPGAIFETLSVTAASATSGSMSLVNERPPNAPRRSTFGYRTGAAAGNDFASTYSCGEEVPVFQVIGTNPYTASASELKLQQPLLCGPFDSGSVTYVYEKQ